jgi:nicotinamide riboside kinase
MTTYINIFGGPGIGKSTTAAEVFYSMKRMGKNVELVSEVAKGFVWEGRHDTLQIQPYVMMKQYRDFIRLKDKVDYVITDSPILLGIIYGEKINPHLPASYFQFIVDCHNMIFTPSINILLKRSFSYDANGRYQTEKEAHELDNAMKAVLDKNKIEYVEIVPTQVENFVRHEVANSLKGKK